MTPEFDKCYRRILNEIILPKYKRIKYETFGARYSDQDSANYTGSRSSQKRTPGEIQHGIGGDRYNKNTTKHFSNQNPNKTFSTKTKRDPRQSKRMDGSGIYKDDERLGNSKLNLVVKSKFGPYTRMGPKINDPRKYYNNSTQRNFAKRAQELKNEINN